MIPPFRSGRHASPNKGTYLLVGATTVAMAAGVLSLVDNAQQDAPVAVNAPSSLRSASPSTEHTKTVELEKSPVSTPTIGALAQRSTDPKPPRYADSAPAPDVAGCPVAPADSIWRTKVDALPRLSNSDAYIDSIGSGKKLKADFGSGAWDGVNIGIPITIAPAGTRKVSVTFDYSKESDKGPYPIPPTALIEGGRGAKGDRHVIVLSPSDCRVYELYHADPQSDGSWRAGSGAVFDLKSNSLRPAGWTSADAAGLPILPGLARYDEAKSGKIDHALRITVPRSQKSYLWPARHHAGSSSDASLPPMGLRLRLKAQTDISRLPPDARAVAQALKTYGAIVADNGSAWYVSGTQDSRWNNDALSKLGVIEGKDFEAVDVSDLQRSPDSAATRRS